MDAAPLGVMLTITEDEIYHLGGCKKVRMATAGRANRGPLARLAGPRARPHPGHSVATTFPPTVASSGQ